MRRQRVPVLVFSLREVVDHELGHALAQHELGMLRDDEVACVYLNECGGYSGFVGADDTDLLERARQRDRDRATAEAEAERYPEDLATEFAPELQARLDRFGIVYLAGVAAQYPDTRGLSQEKRRAAAADLDAFLGLAHRWRLDAKPWRALDAAILLVDSNYGCIEAARAPFIEKRRLTARELREIFENAPRSRNPHREPPWNETEAVESTKSLEAWWRARPQTNNGRTAMPSNETKLADAAADLAAMLGAIFNPRARGFEAVDPADIAAFVAGGGATSLVEDRITAAYRALDASSDFVHSLEAFRAHVEAERTHRRHGGQPRSRLDLEKALARGAETHAA